MTDYIPTPAPTLDVDWVTLARAKGKKPSDAAQDPFAFLAHLSDSRAVAEKSLPDTDTRAPIRTPERKPVQWGPQGPNKDPKPTEAAAGLSATAEQEPDQPDSAPLAENDGSDLRIWDPRPPSFHPDDEGEESPAPSVPVEIAVLLAPVLPSVDIKILGMKSEAIAADDMAPTASATLDIALDKTAAPSAMPALSAAEPELTDAEIATEKDAPRPLPKGVIAMPMLSDAAAVDIDIAVDPRTVPPGPGETQDAGLLTVNARKEKTSPAPSPAPAENTLPLAVDFRKESTSLTAPRMLRAGPDAAREDPDRPVIPAAPPQQKSAAAPDLIFVTAVRKESEPEPSDTAAVSSAAFVVSTLRGDAALDLSHPGAGAHYLAAPRAAAASLTQAVALQLQRNIAAKIDTMTVQLSPAELGRMDIKLTFEKDGVARAHMSVDRPETLTLLRQDVHQLEKILQQAGVNMDKDAISFDLRHHNPQRDGNDFAQAQGGQGPAPQAARISDAADDGAEDGVSAITATLHLGGLRGVNIMV